MPTALHEHPAKVEEKLMPTQSRGHGTRLWPKGY
jgi:hypothetical protein